MLIKKKKFYVTYLLIYCFYKLNLNVPLTEGENSFWLIAAPTFLGHALESTVIFLFCNT